MEIGTIIRSLRTSYGLTQQELAHQMYVSRQTIVNWELNKTTPDAQSLVMLAALFRVPADTLLSGDPSSLQTMLHQQRATAQRVRVLLIALAIIVCLLATVLAARSASIASVCLLLGILAACALLLVGALHAAAHHLAATDILRDAFATPQDLTLMVPEGTSALAADALDVVDSEQRSIFMITNTARYWRGKRWKIASCTTGRTVAKVALKQITAGVQLPALQARVSGMGTICLINTLKTGAGLERVWHLEGLGMSLEGAWLGDELTLLKNNEIAAQLSITHLSNGSAVYRLHVQNPMQLDAALALTFLLCLLRACEQHVDPPMDA